MVEIYARVSGRVQMVMFRDFVQRKARKFGIIGYVKNLGNGTVEIVAQGDKDVLEQFLVRIHHGSLFSRVDSVDIIWRDPGQLFDVFSIVH